MVSTPRSGNSWLRRLLDHVYGFSGEDRGELALYNPLEAPWSGLPGRCVLMTHWPRAGPLPALLEEHGFRVVTLARHPLDVLISILHYAPSGASLRWMEGDQGDERPIFGASPRSAAFLDYATGPRARALLSVSPAWWSAPGSLRVRYEDLVRDPLGRLAKLTRSLEHAPVSAWPTRSPPARSTACARPRPAPTSGRGSPASGGAC